MSVLKAFGCLCFWQTFFTERKGVSPSGIGRVGAFLLAFLMASLAWAWPPTYGAEFELTRHGLGDVEFNPRNASTSDEKKEQMRFVEVIQARCKMLGCTVQPIKGKWDTDYRVTYPDGWWFKVSYDPTCVEITFKPSTLEVLETKVALINDHIFETGKMAGLHVGRGDTSHFNMGIRSAFNDSAKNFLRFYVDYANHPDLALGSLGKDIYNGPPLSLLGEDQRQALKQIVADVESGKLLTLGEVTAAIQQRVYTRSYEPSWGAAHHYQAVGLKYVNQTNLATQDAPFELRSVWIQDRAEQFNLIARLMEARIGYLNNQAGPIEYSGTDRTDFSRSELRTRFAIYVGETGLDPATYEALLPDEVRDARMSAFLDPRARADKRLHEISKYWDVIEKSPYAQQKALEIVMDPQLRNNSEAYEISQRLRLMKRAAPPTVAPMCSLVFH